MPAEKILFFPLNRRGMGSGHLRRCWKAARELGEKASIVLERTSPENISAAKWANEIEGFPGFVSILESGSEESAIFAGTDLINGDDSGADTSFPSCSLTASTAPGTLIVFDRRSTDMAELKRWARVATPVLLDDTGSAVKRAPFVVNAIPGEREGEANITDIRLLDLPSHRRSPDASGPVLVSFGGHDPANLTIPAVQSLLARGTFAPSQIAVTRPSGFSEKDLPEGVADLGKPKDLKERLGNYGLVVCSYGLTAWEAVAAGCAVLIIDPTPYHESLSKQFGFPALSGFLKDAASSAEEARRNVEQSSRRIAERAGLLGTEDAGLEVPGNLSGIPASASSSGVAGTAENPGFSETRSTAETPAASGGLSDFLGELEAPSPRCAACGNLLPPVIARFPARTYYRCPRCGMTGLYRFRLKKDEYGPSYFEREYRNQYGRTYLEDFGAIKAMAFSRLRIIRSRMPSGGSLLDIGCAFGPFLDASRQEGWEPYGIDVSEEGVAYVRNELGLPARRAMFPFDNPAEIFGIGAFDAVTLWYVIEHFPNVHAVLEAVSSLIRRGGVLALSTPNGSGISGRRDFRRFLENSPEDHYTIWTPQTARRLLSKHGFRVYRIRVTGHHPERFAFSPRKGSVLFRSAGLISRLMRLGDTFEVYAVKES